MSMQGADTLVHFLQLGLDHSGPAPTRDRYRIGAAEWEDADDEMQTIVDGSTTRARNFVPRTSSQERGGGWSQSKDSDAVKKESTERLSHKASPAGGVTKMIAGELLNDMSQFTDLIDKIHYVHIVQVCPAGGVTKMIAGELLNHMSQFTNY
jgi:hypothetical protein